MPIVKEITELSFVTFFETGSSYYDNLEPYFIHLRRRTFCGDLWNYQPNVDVCFVSNSGNYTGISTHCGFNYGAEIIQE
jgi:hypothetical protein